MTLGPSPGGVASGLGSIYKTGTNIWIGWPGISVDESREKEVTGRLSKLNLVPVFLTENDIAQYYEGYSNATLWPVFHYMPSYAQYDDVFWEYYKSVNEKFKEVVLAHAEAGDTIWIHDYQLLLLPSLIREAIPDITIGFFLHVPFPSFELFRLLPHRNELLSGMLGTDLAGFHTIDDANHFESAVTRLLPFNSSAKIVTVNDRQVMIDSFPMGISNEYFEQLTETEAVKKKIATLKKTFTGRKIILSIDRLDYSKGILQRLQAFDLLLSEYPDYIEQITFYMVVVPSRDTVPQYKNLKDEIDKLAGNINARYRTIRWNPINYFYRSFPVDMISALYNIADICLVTPMRDGMNLVAKEYVASRVHNDGVLILSEMAGASKELVDAVIVNPNNIRQISEAIVVALNMPLIEKEKRMKQMRQIVARYNIHQWVKIYMQRLHQIKVIQQSMQARHAVTLAQREIKERYMRSNKRILFLDYDGTLIGFNANLELAYPDHQLRSLLEKLTQDEKNKVVIISGRKHESLEQWFGNKPIDLIAEHGVWYKEEGVWKHVKGLSDEWKQDAMTIMNAYTERTPGSLIETKSYSLVWHYRKVDNGLGELRANELINDLKSFAQDRMLQVLQGDKVVEIKSAEVNKGKAAVQWMKDEVYDFILALGDDHTDEDLFKALPGYAYTIKVGSNFSHASYYLQNPKEVRSFLNNITSMPKLSNAMG